MRRVFSLKPPTGSRILLIESGSRSVMEGIVKHLNETWGEGVPIDLLTCYAGVPEGLQTGPENHHTSVFHVADYNTPELRRQLLDELRRRDYAYAGMICAAEPVMNKWKWWLALKVPAKFFIINENGDYFWLNRKNAKTIRRFALMRLGLAGGGALRTFARLLLFPLGVLYLLFYAGAVHLRRFLRVKLLRT